LSDTYPGSVHDKKICDIESLEFDKDVTLLVDLGFIGLTSQKATILIPYKKSKKKELSVEQKKFNKKVSQARVQIEHILGSVKISRKAKDKFRGRLFAREDKVILVACGLHNLKMQLKTNNF
jgi:hypothetical protein